MSRLILRSMPRITVCLPADLALWLNGMAAARRLSRSRVLSDILVEQRARFAKESEELEVLSSKKKSRLPRKSQNSNRVPRRTPSRSGD